MMDDDKKESTIEKEREELIKLYQDNFGFIVDDVDKSIQYSNLISENNYIEYKNIIM